MRTRSIARYPLTHMVAAVFLLSAGSREANADITTYDCGLPPQGAIGGVGVYKTAGDIHAMYSGAGLNAVLSSIEHGGFSNVSISFPSDPSGGTDEQENFDSTLTGLASINGAPNVPFTLTGPVSVLTYGRSSDMETGTFNTKMLSLDMTGTLAGHAVEIKLDPANATLGQVTVSAIGGGLYNIASFFDVFTEISIDGGQFIPQVNGPTHVTLETVPEPSTLVMGAVAVAIWLVYISSRRLPAASA